MACPYPCVQWGEYCFKWNMGACWYCSMAVWRFVVGGGARQRPTVACGYYGRRGARSWTLDAAGKIFARPRQSGPGRAEGEGRISNRSALTKKANRTQILTTINIQYTKMYVLSHMAHAPSYAEALPVDGVEVFDPGFRFRRNDLRVKSLHEWIPVKTPEMTERVFAFIS